MAAVYGPAPAKVQRMEKLDRATVEVDFKPESGIRAPAEAEREMLLRRSLEEVVLLARYPRCIVSVVIQVCVMCVTGFVLVIISYAPHVSYELALE